MDGVAFTAEGSDDRETEDLDPGGREEQAEERPAEDAGRWRLDWQVPGVVRGIKGPGEIEAANDGRRENEHPDRLGRAAQGEVGLRQKGNRHDGEQDCQTD